MKTVNQNKGLERLGEIRETFRKQIETDYEPAAKNCLTCEVQGSCCTDAHFVNVHISRLEAVAISRVIEDLDEELREKVIRRNEEAVGSLATDDGSIDFEKSYSCPLFEPGIGCLVHKTAKPLPCINHACYENESDLPPSEILTESELRITRLNDRVYRKGWNWLPIPQWLQRVL